MLVSISIKFVFKIRVAEKILLYQNSEETPCVYIKQGSPVNRLLHDLKWQLSKLLSSNPWNRQGGKNQHILSVTDAFEGESSSGSDVK
jgi:hypothetical protein